MGEEHVGRIRMMDQQRVNLDGFAHEDAGLGLIAMNAPDDPEPSIRVEDGRVVEMDGTAEADFDSLDSFIATHGIDVTVAEEAMALDDVAFARLFVDPAVPRAELVRLVPAPRPPSSPRSCRCCGRPSSPWP